jgi:hypothetical protein
MSGQGDLVRLTPVRRSFARTTYLAQSIRLEDGTAPTIANPRVKIRPRTRAGAVPSSSRIDCAR